MKSCCIYYWENWAGVTIDVQLINECLSSHFERKVFEFSYYENDHDIFFNNCINKKYDIGIFNQNFDLRLLENNKINVYICNEEWLGNEVLDDLKYFDYIIVKNKAAKEKINHLHKNVICLYFWSRDLYDKDYDSSIDKRILHFAGKSIQKNTECLLNNEEVIIFDSNSRFKDVRDINYFTRYISNNKLSRVFNLCETHVCPSFYEAHGHYMFEALLCNKNVIASKIPAWLEQVDPSYINFIDTEIQQDNTYKFLSKEHLDRFIFRQGYFVNNEQLESTINNPTNKPPREYIKNLFTNNKNKFLDFFTSL